MWAPVRFRTMWASPPCASYQRGIVHLSRFSITAGVPGYTKQSLGEKTRTAWGTSGSLLVPLCAIYKCTTMSYSIRDGLGQVS